MLCTKDNLPQNLEKIPLMLKGMRKCVTGFLYGLMNSLKNKTGVTLKLLIPSNG
jgi:hypothetical protein